METYSVVVTAVANHAENQSDPIAVQQAKITSDWAIDYLGEEEDTTEPFADMYYPVIDSIDDVLIEVTEDTKALGSVAFSFYWRHALKNYLPPNSRGVILVFENPCKSQVFTYQIDGKEPIFLGYEDVHDPKYGHRGKTRSLASLTNMNGIYTGLPMNSEFCPYNLTVYPSYTMEKMHVTSDPIYYAIAVAAIFFLTSLVFLSYDWFVNKRQTLIKKRALASGEIVASLFPEQVRDVLYQENAAKTGSTQDQSDAKLQFRASTGSKDKGPTARPVGTPNAHLYEGTSIFFADLVGFTQWSSKRTPAEVFELLETICKMIQLTFL